MEALSASLDGTGGPAVRNRSGARRPRPRRTLAAAVITLLVLTMSATGVASAQPAATGTDGSYGAHGHGQLDFGPNVRIFDPSMPVSQIQGVVDAVNAQQKNNQFGPERISLLFKPGTYGSSSEPLNFEVGYYTGVAGLGLSPDDVVINGSINVRNQCEAGSCIALNNFWRSLSNLRINVTNPDFGCYTGEFWAVSQAAPMRRVHINGQTTLMDYCTGPSFASGGFIADSQFDAQIISGSQQQWITRNSALNGWTNGVWNQVFSGTVGAPATCFPAGACGGPYTTVATSPVTREAPVLYTDPYGRYRVFVPSARKNSVGTSWSNGPAAGRSIPIDKFYVAKPGDDVDDINKALSRGQNLILTPGIYKTDKTIKVKRADTVVLGLGFATIVPQRGNIAMTVDDVAGVGISGIIFDAGPKNSRLLLQVGSKNSHRSNANNPTALQDVFFRIGGAAAGKATVSLEVNSDNTILDNTWAWRADHGDGVGWTINTADTGVIVNGDDVTAYGLFVEHYQKTEVIWNGNGGTVIFFQNEMPYDPPNQAAWQQSRTVKGYPALQITRHVKSFTGYGMGSYSFFNQGVDIFADNAFVVDGKLPAGSLNNMLTIFLDPSVGKGGILNVVNGIGGSSTIANPDVPVTVVSFP
jgi:hypothetical protein